MPKASGRPDPDKDAEFTAFEQVHRALLPLTAEQRGRVLASVTTLLATTDTPSPVPSGGTDTRSWAPMRSSRPLSLVELLKEKAPVTNPGKITLFAYHREKNEGKPRFGRDDLEAYFAVAHEQPPTHYGRDFVAAVKKGWIHEAGSESYITSKGIEEVEAGFPNERKWKTTLKKKGTKKKGTTRR